MTYKTKGVCAQGIEFEIDDNKKVHNIKFTGGCSGNTQGVAHLAEGMDSAGCFLYLFLLSDICSVPFITQ